MASTASPFIRDTSLTAEAQAGEVVAAAGAASPCSVLGRVTMTGQ